MLNIHKSNGITIDQNHTCFEDSEFENYSFTIKIIPLTKTQWKQYRKESQTKQGIDENIFSSKIFQNHVVGWTDIKDDEGNEIKYSEENKKLIDDSCPFFSSRVASACLSDIGDKQKELEKTKKN